MSEQSKNKKLILGSALAGLVVAGPGVSLTHSGNFFQTAKLEGGYRLAKAEAKSTSTKDDKAADTKGKDSHCCDGKCGEGKCGKNKDASCGKDKKDSNATTGAKATDKSKAHASCGEGACGN